METLARERAAAGAALLDERLPGWADKVNLDTLEMWSPSSCVLAQAYGSFTGAVDVFGLVYEQDTDRPSVIDLGFEAPNDDPESNEREDTFAWLDIAWADEVRSRV